MKLMSVFFYKSIFNNFFSFEGWLIIMAELVKFNELDSTAYISLVLKVLTLAFMALTIFIPIMKVDYTATGVEAILTIFSFNASLDLKQGTSSDIPSRISTGTLDIFFILVVIGIVITIILLFLQKNRLGAVANTFSIVVLLILFINFVVAGTLDGKTMSNGLVSVTIHITNGLGYYLLLVALVFLLVSSFTKFKLKEVSPKANSNF